MNIRHRMLFAFSLVVIVTAIAVDGYRTLGPPGVSFLDAIYMAVVTLAGVGYGEIVSTQGHTALRVFNIFIILIGAVIWVYLFSSITAFLVEGELTNIFWRRKMQKRISELKHHYIVCGLGDTGRYAVDELQKTGTPYVVIESQQEHVDKFLEHRGDSHKSMLYLLGDATDEELLDQAGLRHAKGLIAALASDKDNLVITVMVRQKNPRVRIISRCTDLKYTDRMIKAGANSTVSPNQIGGLRMASEVLRPHVVGFLDLMLKERSRTLRIEEVEVGSSSHWVGRKLGEVNLRAHYNLNVLAVKKTAAAADTELLVNPPDDFAVGAGTVLIVMGDVNDVKRARHEAQHEGSEITAATSVS